MLYEKVYQYQIQKISKIQTMINLFIIFNKKLNQDIMQGSFALAAYKKKNQEQVRKVTFRQTKMRYVVLFIACLVVFGCQYCFDNPSALQTEIQDNYEHDNHQQLGQAKFNLLYSLYSFPNIIIPLIGGILIDKIGARIVLIITAVFCVLGQIVFGFGGLSNSFALMLFGRAVFGIGGQVLHASQNTIISNWFKASQLSMALGICISFPKLGSSLNSILSPSIGGKVKEEGKYWNVALPIFVGLGIMIGSLILAVILALIDRKSDKAQTILHESQLISKQKEPSLTQKKSVKSVKLVDESHYQDTEKQAGQHIKLSDIKELPITFWLLILISMLSEALFIPFLDNGNYYYQKVFKGIETPDEAGIYLILPYVISSMLVPIMGYFVDKIGKRSEVLIASIAFIVFTYGFMLSVQTNVSLRQSEIVRWIPTFLLGVCVAIFCTIIVPTVPMLVKPKLLGTGFGIMEMIQNLGLAVFPLISGLIRQTQESKLKGFHLQTLFFFIVSCFCLCLTIYLKTADTLTGSKMQVKDFRQTYIKSVLKQK